MEKMRQELGFRDIDEMNTWLQGPRFGGHFQEYAQEWIYPEQDRIRQTDGVRARGPNLMTGKRLIHGERPGSDKFSFKYTDRNDWDHVDHLAKLIYEIRRENTKSMHGVFFKKTFTEDEMNHRIWILIKHQEKEKPPTDTAVNPPDPSHAAEYNDLARDSLHTKAAPVPSLGVPPSPDELPPPPPDVSPSPPPDDEVSSHLLVNETDDGGGTWGASAAPRA